MIILPIFLFIYSLIIIYHNIKSNSSMATSATMRNLIPRAYNSIRAPIPSNYFCKSCGSEAHHWIMDCSLLAIFHAANNILTSMRNKKDRSKKQDSTDTLVQIACQEHKIANCQSLYRIIMALRFYQNNAKNDKALLQYFQRYSHLLNDYTHILSDHLDQDKDTNDLTAALIHGTVTQHIQCDITKCPHFMREYDALSLLKHEDELLTFYKHTLDTIHCYFIHPFHTGFKMIKTRSFAEKHCVDHKTDEENDESITWNDEELNHLQTELNVRRHLLRTKHGIEYNKYNKFMINIPQNIANKNTFDDDEKDEKDEKVEADAQLMPAMKHYFGDRYYYWDWYKTSTSKDWRCNEDRTYSELYIAPKYSNIKEEITSNTIFQLSAIDFNRIMVKAQHYLDSSQVIRRLTSRGSEFCHYGIRDGSAIQLHHLIAIILHTDFRQLSYHFVSTFRKINMYEKQFKLRKSEYHFWSKYLREAVELYGTPLNESKTEIFYVSISHPVLFDSFQARFCLPTSCSSALQIVTMCTQNGLILELKSTAESVQFYSGALKYFNCSLLSRFGEEHERLFIGGWAPLQFNNIRILVERRENYLIFIQAIQHFNAVLNGEESDDFDYNALMSGCTTSYFTSYLSRGRTSYESSYSQQTALSRMDSDRMDMKTGEAPMIRRKPTIIFQQDDDMEKCSKTDAIVIDKLCQRILNERGYKNGYPLYINTMFKHMLYQRESVFINLHELKTNFKAFESVLLSQKCKELIRFDVLNTLLLKCRVITVDMAQYEQLNTQYFLALCKQMVGIQHNNASNLEKIVFLRVKKENITLNIWDQIHRKYKKKCGDCLWFQCLSKFRYSNEKKLQLFFDEKAFAESQKEGNDAEDAADDNLDQNQNDQDFWPIDAPKSYRL